MTLEEADALARSLTVDGDTTVGIHLYPAEDDDEEEAEVEAIAEQQPEATHANGHLVEAAA